jgi:hypothetical protein
MKNITNKKRSDTGTRLTPRDLIVLRWGGEQHAMRFDQGQRLMAHYAEGKLKTPGILSDSSMRHAIDRWESAGFVTFKKFLVATPGVFWLTPAGYKVVGLPFRAEPPSVQLLEHIYQAAQVRLWLLLNRPALAATWQSERWQRHQLDQKIKQVDLPDALLTADIGTIALEIERTAKGPTRLADILKDRALVYDQIWYICSPKTLNVVNNARSKLEDFYQQKILIFSLEQFL